MQVTYDVLLPFGYKIREVFVVITDLIAKSVNRFRKPIKCVMLLIAPALQLRLDYFYIYLIKKGSA